MKSLQIALALILIQFGHLEILGQDDFYNPYVQGLNKERAHAYFHIDSSRILSLDGEWDFMFYKDPDDVPGGFFLKSYKEDRWEKITVPSFIQVSQEEYLKSTLDAIAVYLKDIYIELPEPGTQMILRFDGVTAGFHVWINGFLIGYSEGFGIPAEFNITPFITEGRNLFAVKAYSTPESKNKFFLSRDILHGIYDHVSLIKREAIHVRDIRTDYWLNESYSEVLLRISLFLESFLQNADAGRTVDVFVLSNEDEVLFNEQSIIDFPISYRQELEMSFDFTLDSPLLWSPDSPNLYKVKVIISELESDREESLETFIGFRDVQFTDSLVILNGDSIIPEIAEQVYMGYDYSLQDEEYIMYFLENEYNTLRIYDPLPCHMLDIFDRNGIMVWSLWPEGEILEDSIDIDPELRKVLEYQREYRLGGESNRACVVEGVR